MSLPTAVSLPLQSRSIGQVHALTLSAALVAVLGSGCTTSTPWGSGSGAASGATTPSGQPRPIQRCDAAPAQSLIGKSNSAQTLDAARKLSGAYMARVLSEGQPTTREFNAERLNLVVDANGKIVAVRCG
jgi:hypothetical protein